MRTQHERGKESTKEEMYQDEELLERSLYVNGKSAGMARLERSERPVLFATLRDGWIGTTVR